MEKTLAIGMTVGLRKNKGNTYNYCERSIRSLREGGFKQTLYAFTEPGAQIHIPGHSSFKAEMIQHEKKKGCFRNFRFGLKWLLDHTEADWLLMLQDDAVWRSDGWEVIRQTMEAGEHDHVGMLSPYTSKAMVFQGDKQKFAKKKQEGWRKCHFHNKAFWGAVAMLFPRESARKLEEESQRYRNHKHHRKLDVIVGNALRKELQLEILVRVPSLVEHIGAWSTLGRHKLRGNQWGRKGYHFKKEG